MILVVTLVMVLLNPNGSTTTETREYLDVESCEAAAEVAHEAMQLSSKLDVGTICIKTEFDADKVKPRA